MHIGYAPASTEEQTLDLEEDALKKAGCERLFAGTASGTTLKRPGLNEAPAYLRPGDTLVVWRLGRYLRHLIRYAVRQQAGTHKPRFANEGERLTAAKLVAPDDYHLSRHK